MAGIFLTLFEVVTRDQVLIAQKQSAIGNDRMRPNPALRIADGCLRVKLETPVLFPAFGRSLHERHRAAVFLHTIEHALRTTDRSFAERVFLAPDLLAGFELLAQPAPALRIAVKIIAHPHDTAMVVDHL